MDHPRIKQFYGHALGSVFKLIAITAVSY